MRRQVQMVWLLLAALLWLLAGCVMPDGTVVQLAPIPTSEPQAVAVETAIPEEEAADAADDTDAAEDASETDDTAALDDVDDVDDIDDPDDAADDDLAVAGEEGLVTYTSPDGFLEFDYPEEWLFLGESAEGDLPAAAVGSSEVLLEVQPGSAFPPGELTASILLMPAELLTAMVGTTETEGPVPAVALGVMLALGPANSPEVEIQEPAPFAPLTDLDAYAATVTAQSMQQTLIAFEPAEGIVIIADYTVALAEDAEPPVNVAIAIIGSGRLSGSAEEFLAHVNDLYQ